MKLLRVTGNKWLPLFKEKLDLPFYAAKRAEEDKEICITAFSINA